MVESVFKVWVGLDKKQALQRLEELDDSPLFVAGAKGMLQSLDPTTLEDFCNRVSDPEFRKSAASRLTGLLKISDPDRAERYRLEAARLRCSSRD